MRIQTGRGTIPPYNSGRDMVYLRFKCITGFSGFSDIRETFRYFSSFYGTGYSDAFLFAIVIDNSIYYIVG